VVCNDTKAPSCTVNYDCECEGGEGGLNGVTCGNGAISGFLGQQDIGKTAAQVATQYAPGRVGGALTGWACRIHATVNVCTCIGMPDLPSLCDNGAIGGVSFGQPGGPSVHTNVSIEQVFSLYGPDRTGDDKTGWSCVPQRFDNGADILYTCECVDATCGNGAPSATFGTIITTKAPSTPITALDVDGLYGVHRFGPQNTGWQCTPTGLNVVACEGGLLGPACDNGAVSGSSGATVSAISTSLAVTNNAPGYGVLRRGTATSTGDTGWNAYCSSY
jgi:hypothetical protein